MAEKPILFSGAMVRALLDGTKTQTRRVVTPQPDWITDVEGRDWPMRKVEWPADGRYDIGFQCPGPYGLYQVIKCPYGLPGGLLWVRETFAKLDFPDKTIYRADGDLKIVRWTPAIHMPRTACRLVLEITKVRVERLQAITEADALAEGVRSQIKHSAAYADLWDSLNKERGYGWAVNPWVWVIELQRHAAPSTGKGSP